MFGSNPRLRIRIDQSDILFIAAVIKINKFKNSGWVLVLAMKELQQIKTRAELEAKHNCPLDLRMSKSCEIL